MKEEKKASPISVLLGWGKPYHGKFIGSVSISPFFFKIFIDENPFYSYTVKRCALL